MTSRAMVTLRGTLAVTLFVSPTVIQHIVSSEFCATTFLVHDNQPCRLCAAGRDQ